MSTFIGANSFARRLGLDLYNDLRKIALHNYNNAEAIANDSWSKIKQALSRIPTNNDSKINEDETSRLSSWKSDYKKYQEAFITTKKLVKNLVSARLTMSSAVKLMFKSKIKDQLFNVRSLSQETIDAIYTKSSYPDIEINNLIPEFALNKSDTTLVKQILHILIQNSLDELKEKGGSINISSRRENDKLYISVNDSGKKIAPGIQSKMFNESFSSKNYGNQGIGLYFAKKFAEVLGGTLNYKEEPEKMFELMLPIPKEEGVTLHSQSKAPNLYPKKVLILDDEPYLRDILQNMFKKQGGENIETITTHSSIQELISSIKEVPSSQDAKATLIVTDWNLGYSKELNRGQTALDLMKELKETWEQTLQKTPLPKVYVLSGLPINEAEISMYPNYLGTQTKPMRLENINKIYEAYQNKSLITTKSVNQKEYTCQ